MIDFMVIGLPRSGTTWAANWLSTGRAICHHDPLWHTHYGEWDYALTAQYREHWGTDAVVGVACTGIWRWPGFVNRHPSRKLIIERGSDEIRASLGSLGVRDFEPYIEAKSMLQTVEGERIHYKDLFDPVKAERIWVYLMGDNGPGFCTLRHQALIEMNMQPQRPALRKDSGLHDALTRELIHNGVI